MFSKSHLVFRTNCYKNFLLLFLSELSWLIMWSQQIGSISDTYSRLHSSNPTSPVELITGNKSSRITCANLDRRLKLLETNEARTNSLATQPGLYDQSKIDAMVNASFDAVVSKIVDQKMGVLRNHLLGKIDENYASLKDEISDLHGLLNKQILDVHSQVKALKDDLDNRPLPVVEPKGDDFSSSKAVIDAKLAIIRHDLFTELAAIAPLRFDSIEESVTKLENRVLADLAEFHNSVDSRFHSLHSAIDTGLFNKAVDWLYEEAESNAVVPDVKLHVDAKFNNLSHELDNLRHSLDQQRSHLESFVNGAQSAVNLCNEEFVKNLRTRMAASADSQLGSLGRDIGRLTSDLNSLRTELDGIRAKIGGAITDDQTVAPHSGSSEVTAKPGSPRHALSRKLDDLYSGSVVLLNLEDSNRESEASLRKTVLQLFRNVQIDEVSRGNQEPRMLDCFRCRRLGRWSPDSPRSRPILIQPVGQDSLFFLTNPNLRVWTNLLGEKGLRLRRWESDDRREITSLLHNTGRDFKRQGSNRIYQIRGNKLRLVENEVVVGRLQYDVKEAKLVAAEATPEFDAPFLRRPPSTQNH